MKILLMILAFFVSGKTYSQTYEEWFQQTKTQKKYLLQQIAALKVYIGYAEKGFYCHQRAIYNSGYQTW